MRYSISGEVNFFDESNIFFNFPKPILIPLLNSSLTWIRFHQTWTTNIFLCHAYHKASRHFSINRVWKITYVVAWKPCASHSSLCVLFVKYTLYHILYLLCQGCLDCPTFHHLVYCQLHCRYYQMKYSRVAEWDRLQNLNTNCCKAFFWFCVQLLLVF